MVAAAAKREAELAPPPARKRRWLAVLLVFMGVTAATALLLLGRARDEIAVATGANLRAEIVVLARRIGAFQAEHGRAPRALAELGNVPPGLTYHVIDAETWELRAARDGDTLRFRSGENPRRFLADTIPGREPARP